MRSQLPNILGIGFWLGMTLGGGSIVRSAEPPLPPTISVAPDVYYPLDEVLYLEGRAQRNTSVQIRLQKSGARPVQFAAKSDANGEWALAEKVPLGAGDWEVRARVVGGNGQARLPDGQTSEWSNPRAVKAVASGVTIGGVNLKFTFLALVFFSFLLASGAVFLYLTQRVRRLKSVLLQKEVREAQESVREGISEIRRDLLEELRLIGSASKPLTAEARARKEHILRELDQIERNMSREISDIDRHQDG